MIRVSVKAPYKKTNPELPLQSSRPLISWPAIPSEKGAQLLALLHQLDQSQWWSPDKLRRAQFIQVLNLLHHARKTVPYYKDRLSFLDGVSELTESLWKKIPILTRHDLQESEEQLLSTSIPPSHGAVSEIRTSGSTGRPVRVKRTETFFLFHHLFTLREHWWLDQNLKARQMVIRSVKGLKPGQVKVQGTWGPPYNLIYNTGQSVIMEITTDIETQLQNLIKYQPDYLLTYPSNLQALLHYGKAESIKQLNLSQVRTLSESVSDELRKEVSEKLGVKLIDVYSAHEVGAMALQCPEHDHYHVQSENVLLEILRDDGSVCEPGETGQVVVTSLHNFAMPLIRYSLQDYAVAGEPCDCGRGLPVLKHILGRTRNMVAMPDGTRVWPAISVGALTVADIAPVAQIQLIQHSVEKMEARLVPTRKLTTSEEQQVIQVIQESLRHPFHIKLTYLDEIPRSSSGKFETFISLV